MTLKSYAKINLGLRILHKRPDGYHDLETIFHEINLWDEIEFSPSPRIEIHVQPQGLPSDENNLCHKAAQLLRTQCNIASGVSIKLVKQIPVGAGLGGGSSNAATVLRGLRKFWKVALTDDDLLKLGAQIGSDVPFFIKGGSAYATGRGEQLEPLSLRLPFWIVTATPKVHVSTPWAYTALRWNETRRPLPLKARWHPLPTREELRELLRNDFEPVVFGAYPAIADLHRQYMEMGAAAVALSGSGSTMYGLFENEIKAVEARNRLAGDAATSFTEPEFSAERT
ncbi:MAG: 4-(cytidine 5'-diphospho)-2-C-methyl-D-erythritol kinase [Ignavibacteriales bacterium]|nr:4-(cytidine 5'-diphospho)-2-C-methyl-D-erythritol kinase [Ignavibacteriales bacterium]